MNYIRTAWIAMAGVMLLCGAGCSQFDLRRRIPWLDEEKNDPLPPEKVVAIWTDTVLYQPNQAAQRGFGGRLMFYKGGDSKSIKVDGTLVVYAFDEEGRDKQDFQSRADLRQPGPEASRKGKKGARPGSAGLNSKPDRKYVITPEQFEKHYSKSNLGHSYSVWVPWDAAGGSQREISLIVRFIPKEGGAIIGEQTTHVLPGATASEETAPAVPAAALPLTGLPPAAGVPGVVMPSAAMPGVGVPGAGVPSAATVSPTAAAAMAALARPWDPAVQQASCQTAVPAPPAEQTPTAASRMHTTTIGVPPQSSLRNATAMPVTSRLERARAASLRTVPQPGQESAATPAPTTQATPAPAARYAPQLYQAPAEPPSRLKYDRAPWQPRPAEWRSAPQSAPPADSGS